MDLQVVRDQLLALLPDHILARRHRRNFNLRIFDGNPAHHVPEFFEDRQSFIGRVVAQTEEIIVLQVQPADFVVLERCLVTTTPKVEELVHVQPYVRRGFDGQRPGELSEDGRPSIVERGMTVAMLSTLCNLDTIKLPVSEPKGWELQWLVAVLEELPAPDGYRRIAHMLVDANASDFQTIDPDPRDQIETSPSISFYVATGKFSGKVTIRYELVFDAFEIELHRDDELCQSLNAVHVSRLGEELERLIDDGSWKDIALSILEDQA
ncbi:GTPase [Pseudomonas aeruginosa]|uniref:GTPase n=1 Tax=Pseudomonas aeruginosa TaxID=287 RepID=UPI000F7E5848|nr:GTPase [Pseudomonas aeruginosa]RTB44097.1 GTPase [Pseudomonas aeruginosa]